MDLSVSHQQGSWVYPLLKPDEIIVCMNELAIPLTMEDLQKPTASKMQIVYTAFADIIMGVTKEHFDASLAACELAETSPDHFDIYADSVLLVMFYRELRVLMTEVGFPEFALADVTKPEPKRVRRILSAIINFAKFREERIEVYESFTAKAGAYAQRLDDLHVQRAELGERLARADRRRQEEAPLVADAQAAIEEVVADLRKLKEVEVERTREMDVLKQEKDALRTTLEDLQRQLQEGAREKARIEARIVVSPEKLRDRLAQMSEALVNERRVLSDKGKEQRELVAKADLLDSLEGDVQSCIRLMEECEAELVKVEAAQKRVAQSEEQANDQRHEVRELTKREEQLRRKLANAEDKLARARRQLESKREAARDRMARTKLEHQVVNEERATADNEIARKMRQIETFEAKMRAIRADALAEQHEVNNEIAKLKAHVGHYIKEASRAMEAF